MEPVYLRHKDAKQQAIMFSVFALVAWAIPTFMIGMGARGQWWYLLLVIPAIFLTYSAVRLASLRVRLDEAGIWEPNPFRLSYHTPWEDVRRIRKGEDKGAMGLRFLTIEIVHGDGTYHDIVALKIQGGAAYAESTVREWLDQIREAKRLSQSA